MMRREAKLEQSRQSASGEKATELEAGSRALKLRATRQ